MSQATWQRSIEQLVLTAARENARVIGLAALKRGAGVSLVCHQLARTIAGGGTKTLFLDTCEVQGEADRVDNASALISPSAGGYDIFRAQSNEHRRQLFGSALKVRQLLSTDLAEYGSVIVDLPPLTDETDMVINTTAIASVCDRLLLLCVVGQDTRADLAEAVANLKSAGATPAGIISNERFYIDPRERLQRRTRRGRDGMIAPRH